MVGGWVWCSCRGSSTPLGPLPPTTHTYNSHTLSHTHTLARTLTHSHSHAHTRTLPLLAHTQVATVLVYLSDAEEGGETVFLLEGREGLARLAHIDYKACDTGIRVSEGGFASLDGGRGLGGWCRKGGWGVWWRLS